MKKLLFLMMACAGLCACSSDDIDLGSTQKVFEGDVAYMKVNLNVNGGTTRASEVNYSAGSQTEDAVTDAYFYFYDASGSFVTEGELTSLNSSNEWSSQAENDVVGEIDQKSNKVIILEGLTGKDYPKYVVTVLNKPTSENFTYGNTLSDMEKKLAGGIYDGGTSGNFIMSTSSYSGASDSDYKFVTELTNNSNSFFYTESDADNATPVDIYVERLAAKVTLDVDGDNLTASESTTDNDGNVTHSYYKLVETIAGEPNTDEAGSGEVATDLYVEFLGWKLNATSDDSYLMKNIDSSWSNTYSSWYDGANSYSSNWCMSPSYNNTADETTGKVEGLTYVNLKDDSENNSPLLGMGSNTYCAENTNSTVESKSSPAITSILVKAQAYDKDENGNYKEVSLVRYEGLLFTLDAFFGTIGLDNGYYADAAGTTPLSSTQLSISDGKISVNENQTIYKEGVAVSSTDDLFSSVETAGFDYFNGGLMYYSIPIKHVNTTTVTNSDGSIPEGVYGVVRNYHYNVSITGLTSLGKPLSSEDETIIPDSDDTTTYYYVPAEINILSWKELTQEEQL